MPLIADSGTAGSLTTKLRAQRELFLLRQEDQFIDKVFDKFKDPSSKMLPLQNLVLAFKELDLTFKDDAEIETVFKTMDTNSDGCKRIELQFHIYLCFCDLRVYRAGSRRIQTCLAATISCGTVGLNIASASAPCQLFAQTG
jgi:hypothetical protein